ncbi:MAG TPA: GAF domain-containing sensor histidine kinase [Conexibacter sp.]|jgi:hypothetical protein|nr:GAF domain-containing sensor histidine kinase [Conexibacter sp.]
MGRTGAESGRVYMLQLDTADFRPFASVPDGASAHGRVICLQQLAIPPGRIGTLRGFLQGASRARAQLRPELGVVVYAYRDGSCVGTIRLDGIDVDALDAETRSELVASSDMLVSIYEDRFAFELLGAIQEPLDFAQNSEEFFRDIGLLIAQSSGMEYAALRELDGDRLRCIALYGFDDYELERSAWDLGPIGDYPAFEQALAGRTVAVGDATARASGLGPLQAQPWSRSIGSFVAVPVHVGTDVFGVLSVAARCTFDYAPVELRGFESIANGVGVSITNFRSSRDLATQVSNQTEAAVAITGIEVARYARHEAIGHINDARIGLHRLRNEIARPTPTVRDRLDSISADLGDLMVALNKVQLVTKVPREKWEIVPVRRLWDEARNAVSGRLQALRIADHWQGPGDVAVHAVADRLRHVFLNLLLNSVDAFAEVRVRNRRIDVSLERPSDRANHFTITYRDNATGINPQRLYVPEEYAAEPVSQQIFGAAVTSKDEGSGYGLWLVRNIMREHGGSIDLTDYRNGVTFVIRLPKPDAWSPRKGSKS